MESSTKIASRSTAVTSESSGGSRRTRPPVAPWQRSCLRRPGSFSISDLCPNLSRCLYIIFFVKNRRFFVKNIEMKHFPFQLTRLNDLTQTSTMGVFGVISISGGNFENLHVIARNCTIKRNSFFQNSSHYTQSVF